MTRVVAAALVFVAGCMLGGAPPTYQYVVLAPERRAVPAAATVPADDAAAPPVLMIGRVTFPDYLVRDEVARRRGTYGIAYSRRERWAEPLDTAFERVLQDELAGRLEPAIAVQARQVGIDPTYTLNVDVARFEQHGAAAVELQARWTLYRGEELVHTGGTEVRRPLAGDGAEAMAAALSAAIGELAGEVAAEVRRLDGEAVTAAE